MLTLEEAIKPILEVENTPGYGPVQASEGTSHWFVFFGFDGGIAPGDVPYAIDKKTGRVDFFPPVSLERDSKPTPIEREMDGSRLLPIDSL